MSASNSICDGCGLKFDPFWRYPGETGVRQGFCTRCHALWLECVIAQRNNGVMEFFSYEMALYLSGEKPLLPHMSFTVVAEDKVRKSVRKALEWGAGVERRTRERGE